MKKWLRMTLLIVSALVFLGSSTLLILYYMDSRQQAKAYDDLSALHQLVTLPSTEPEKIDPTAPVTEPAVTLVTVTDPETGEAVELLPELAELYLLNNDLVGWIRLPGTVLDYPVVQKPEKRDYYLRRDFYGKTKTQGCIYVREECDVFAPSDNLTIYGHRMRNGSMFAPLGNYLEQSFWQENPFIYFDTLKERNQYEIFSVFLTTASLGEGFEYHTFVDAYSAEDFDGFVANCKELSLYDTGITPGYGDKLITLSTCDKSLTNGRLVVVARKITQ